MDHTPPLYSMPHLKFKLDYNLNGTWKMEVAFKHNGIKNTVNCGRTTEDDSHTSQIQIDIN